MLVEATTNLQLLVEANNLQLLVEATNLQLLVEATNLQLLVWQVMFKDVDPAGLGLLHDGGRQRPPAWTARLRRSKE